MSEESKQNLHFRLYVIGFVILCGISGAIIGKGIVAYFLSRMPWR
jgi:hypothetical protein